MPPVWNYFQVNGSDKNKAECKLCPAEVSRGGTKATAYNTSNLFKHLKSRPDAEYKEFTRVVSTPYVQQYAISTWYRYR